MSDKILRALMQLFALVAENHVSGSNSRGVVELFLRQQLNLNLVGRYLAVFDEFLAGSSEGADAEKKRKRISAKSVKILSICTNINKELNLRQKYIVLVRLLEFMYAADQISDQEKEFALTVSDVFNIPFEEFTAAFNLADKPVPDNLPDSPLFLLVDDARSTERVQMKHLYHESMRGKLWMLYLKSAGIFFLRYNGEDTLLLNGQLVAAGRVHVFTQGSVIRGAKTEPLYYSDAARLFLSGAASDPIHYRVEGIEFRFPSGKMGLQELNFNAVSGNLVAIMGGSGAGKSTLLRVLNGNACPSKGKVLLNGLNIHAKNERPEGAIGYIHQDDMLMEDLTVYQNLYYSSRLSFGNLDAGAIRTKVEALLESIGLSESRDLKVGNALNPKISGGQRKRLNIALELIREPSVLFVDEPTSGLSSRDSENVMDLLKQLAISGKLVFVVIHQPSSDIFKLFDQLLLLDTGGYPVYFGNPTDALIYFKRLAEYANAEDSECPACGNINPEQIFSVLEARVLDEYGNQQNVRKVTPDKWNQFFRQHTKALADISEEESRPLKNEFRKPSLWKQFGVFVKRDVLSKLSNRQYLLITLLEAPALAFVLSFLVKYHKSTDSYSFFDNPNLPAYLFMAVIVALFLGLTVSAEEIFRDRKIRKRESFLHLSYGSYLWSKIFILFIISALQSLLLIVIGNSILGIKDMYADYWLVLFSASCFANLVGLNISSAFNSAVTIYILIPIIIIPQLLLSGVIVKFEKLNPSVSSQTKVPLLGEIMASRWAFEALAVNQFSRNEYEKQFFDLDKKMSSASFQTRFRISRLEDEVVKAEEALKSGNTSELVSSLRLLKNELGDEVRQHPTQNGLNPEDLVPGKFTAETARNTRQFLKGINKLYIDQYNLANRQKDQRILAQQPDENATAAFNKLKIDYTNESLNELVQNRNDAVQILTSGNRIIRRFQPVFMDGSPDVFLRTGFYASRKNVFGKYMDTYGVNLAVIWTMTLILAVMLYFNVLKKTIRWVERLSRTRN